MALNGLSQRLQCLRQWSEQYLTPMSKLEVDLLSPDKIWVQPWVRLWILESERRSAWSRDLTRSLWSGVCNSEQVRLGSTALQLWKIAALLSMLKQRLTEIRLTCPSFSTIGRLYISCCSSCDFGLGKFALGTQLALDQGYVPVQDRLS